jgi:hypothetical protein
VESGRPAGGERLAEESERPAVESGQPAVDNGRLTVDSPWEDPHRSLF